MPKKEVVEVELAAANPNLSPATRFGNLVFVAGQTGRHPITGEVGRDVRERIKMILETGGTLLDNVMLVMKRHSRCVYYAVRLRAAWLLLPTMPPIR